MRQSNFMVIGALACALGIGLPASGQQQGAIPMGSKVYLAPMMEGFEEYLKAAFVKKKVPLEVVESKDKADFQITGHAKTEKASTAKILLLGSWHSKEEASIQVANLKTGEVVFAYAVHKADSAHGKRSTAEACAKHLNKKIEGK